MNPYEELGKIQFQIDRLEISKNNIVRQIEMQLTAEAVKQQEMGKAKLPEDENAGESAT